ncbi:hypothetical protein K450DRAFT_253513 [Umbelopsis ramanniana AG]|uniref:Uncharacterized protein n=1 Tax=Umbelopsis ramanniana AG TaxID=1314678 RepID=A0AAD5E635_UMBRA|nr:uncharacterized protein K450DRAFT_253513 [Umbelopsis ramanniana AG]KAI8577070.1 hypothetical protein K450DRAFT_253513 [Umbelopsis ramanniana AG]
MQYKIICMLLLCSISPMVWSAPIQKRDDMNTNIMYHLSENISSQFQLALQPKLRQFSTNVQRNVFAGLLPHDNEFVVAFSKKSDLDIRISGTIKSTWADQELKIKEAIFNALMQTYNESEEAISHIDDAIRVARQAVVEKIGESVHAHLYDSLISQNIQPLVATAIGKSYNNDIEERIAKNIEGVTSIWLRRSIENGFCVDATSCIDSDLVKSI